jgi:hypothetical protein
LFLDGRIDEQEETRSFEPFFRRQVCLASEQTPNAFFESRKARLFPYNSSYGGFF